MANVLLVSGDMQYRSKADTAMEESGHAVLQAECHVTALELFKQDTSWADVVVVDIANTSLTDKYSVLTITDGNKDIGFIMVSEFFGDAAEPSGERSVLVPKSKLKTVVQYIDKLAP